MAEYYIKVNNTDTDVTELIAAHPNFINKLDVSDFRSAYTNFPDTVYARKIATLGWGTEYSNFPYKLIDDNYTDRTPKFLTKGSCPYPYRPAIDACKHSSDNAGGSWGDVDVYLENYPVTLSWSGSTLTININNNKTTVTRESPLVFIDLCGGGGGGGGSSSAYNYAGGGGGGAASCFMAVNMSVAKNITINVGKRGRGGKEGSGDAGGDGGDTTVIIDNVEVIRLGGGKGGKAGTLFGTASGGDGGKCSGTLWNGSSYNTGYGILAIKGFHGKAGAKASGNISVESVSDKAYGKQGDSFKPSSGSDVIPNFGIFEDFKIGYASDGTKNSELGLGGQLKETGGDGLRKWDLGGGGGACAMGCGSNDQYGDGGVRSSAGVDGRGGCGASCAKHKDDGWKEWSILAAGIGGAGNCIIHYKTDR